jgi:hypothetical protein
MERMRRDMRHRNQFAHGAESGWNELRMRRISSETRKGSRGEACVRLDCTPVGREEFLGSVGKLRGSVSLVETT